MKRIILLFAGLLAINVYAQDASQLRIYLNPGHGSWGPDDRPMATIPYPATLETGRPDTCGFYESNTNLWKTLAIGERLIANGFKKENVVHSRTQNGLTHTWPERPTRRNTTATSRKYAKKSRPETSTCSFPSTPTPPPRVP